MKLHTAMCYALVDGWNDDIYMNDVVNRAWILADKTPENDIKKYTDLAAAIKVKYINGGERAKTWIPRNLKKLNDALWDGRPREVCVAIALKSIGKIKGTGVYAENNVRERDKVTDWKTVK